MIRYEQDQSVEMKNLNMIKSNFLPASGRVKNSIIAFLHPLRRPISWACQRRFLPSGIRHLLPWRWALEPFSVYGQNWKFLWVPAEFDDIVHGLFWSGLCSFESETMCVIMGQIRQARCFVDVGANCGIYTVLGATINKQIQIIAIEPVPRICAALIRNVSQNKFDTRVTILNIAAGNCDAIVDFHEAEYAGMGSLAVQGYQGQPGRLIRVQCRKLDSVASELNIEPDLIKIDAEGFSDAVLSGASRLLDKVRPRIVLEANPGDAVLRITEILTTHRYAMHLITDNGPELREEIIASAKYRNWLCLPLGQDDRKVPIAEVEV